MKQSSVSYALTRGRSLCERGREMSEEVGRRGSLFTGNNFEHMIKSIIYHAYINHTIYALMNQALSNRGITEVR